jgi:hypothetical protein
MTDLHDLLETYVSNGSVPGAVGCVTAAAAMLLVEDGRVALDDAVDRWLPELAKPIVVGTPASATDDVVPAARPITVFSC